MPPEYFQIGLIIVTLAVAAYALYRASQNGHSLTLASGIEAIKEARTPALELMDIAQMAVNAAEQLKREGKLTNSSAFDHALDLIKKWLPAEAQFDNEDIVNAINAAVLLASATSKQAGASSKNGILNG